MNPKYTLLKLLVLNCLLLAGWLSHLEERLQHATQMRAAVFVRAFINMYVHMLLQRNTDLR